MKKSLLTLGAILGVSAGAFAQGSLYVETGTTANQGLNTVSSNPADSGAGGTYSDYPSGTVTLEIFAATSSGDANLVSQAAAINSDDSTVGGAIAAANLLALDFTEMPFGTSVGSETMQNNFTLSEGTIVNFGTYAIGTSGTLTSGTVGEYGVLAMMTIGGEVYEGALVLNSKGPLQMGGGANPDYNAGGTWPGQNMVLAAPVPEPTTLALAGLGGLSLLALRRRKA